MESFKTLTCFVLCVILYFYLLSRYEIFRQKNSFSKYHLLTDLSGTRGYFFTFLFLIFFYQEAKTPVFLRKPQHFKSKTYAYLAWNFNLFVDISHFYFQYFDNYGCHYAKFCMTKSIYQKC